LKRRDLVVWFFMPFRGPEALDDKPEIICQRTGIEFGVGEELSISLAMKITNSDGCRVCGSD
jgi:hypothetical protein